MEVRSGFSRPRPNLEESMAAEGKQRVWMGVDPGLRGAAALVDFPHFAQAFPIFDLNDTGIFQLVRELKRQFDIQFAYLERIRPLPFQLRGPVATNKLSASYGALRMALISNEIDYQEVEARYWQNRMGCPNRGSKRPSYDRAVELFPQLKITHQIADALVIARLCQLEGKTPGLRTEANQKWRDFYDDGNQQRIEEAWRARVRRPARRPGS
jgi:hypothetical protein